VKSKRLVYLLLPLVLLVWGLIGWRIWAAASDPIVVKQLSAPTLRVKSAKTLYRPVLLLTYGDPFKPEPSRSAPPPRLGVTLSIPAPTLPAASLNLTIRSLAVHPAVPAVALASVTWPQIKYLGVITHAGSNAQVALLTIDSQELVVKTGKSERGVQVLKVFRDSVQLSFSGQRRSFARGVVN
jgi:hypothetical protein